MAGLLSGLMSGQFTDDPEQNKLITQGLLNFGLNLMQSRGRLGQGIGQSGLAAMQGIEQYKALRQKEKFNKLTTDEMLRRYQTEMNQPELTKQATALFPQSQIAHGPEDESGQRPMQDPVSRDYLSAAVKMYPLDKQMAQFTMQHGGGLAAREDKQAELRDLQRARLEARDAETKARLAAREAEVKAKIEADEREQKRALEQEERLRRLVIATRQPAAQDDPGKHTQVVNDPNLGLIIVDKKTNKFTPVTGPGGSSTEGKNVTDAKKLHDQLTIGIEEARKLIPKATGSGAGRLADVATSFVGMQTEGDNAASQLETLAGWMTSNVPRMQGPQSDKDTLLYKQMAAQVGDRSKTRSARLAALNTLEALQKKYAGDASGDSPPAGVDPEDWKHMTPSERKLWQKP